MHPDSNWVEDNMLPICLATAQRLACDYSQCITPESHRNDEQGYADVSGLDVSVPLDSDPVNKLQYIPPKLDRDNVKK